MATSSRKVSFWYKIMTMLINRNPKRAAIEHKKDRSFEKVGRILSYVDT